MRQDGGLMLTICMLEEVEYHELVDIFLKARDEEQERMFQQIKDNFADRAIDSVTPFGDERDERLRSMAMNILPRQENVARRNIKLEFDQPITIVIVEPFTGLRLTKRE